MISQEIRFFRPTNLSEALSLLAQDSGDVTVLAGGMTLIPAMNLGLARPENVVSLNHINSLGGVDTDKGVLRLGALVRHRRVETDKEIRSACPLLSEAAGLIADVQVRHRGTVGGSLAHADPTANYIPAMLALGAQLTLASNASERSLPIGDFIKGALETDLEPREILVEISVPLQTTTQSSAYYRIAGVHGSFSIASAAAVVDAEAGVRVVVGGATESPIVMEECNRNLSGDEMRIAERIGDAVDAACREPIGDLHGDFEYRRSMARVAAKRAVAEAFRRRNG